MTDRNNATYILYGIADRDKDEFVCQFGRCMEDIEAFAECLPGKYRVMTVTGIDYDALEVVSISNGPTEVDENQESEDDPVSDVFDIDSGKKPHKEGTIAVRLTPAEINAIIFWLTMSEADPALIDKLEDELPDY